MYTLESLELSPLTVTQICKWTEQDPLLSRVRKFITQGWPKKADLSMKMYQSKKLELSVQDGCLLWGSRIIIPKPGRAALLHEDLTGVSKMKGLTPSYVWWPNIDANLESEVKQCNQCQLNCPLPPVVPMHPWEWPDHPWNRVYADYAEPFMV